VECEALYNLLENEIVPCSTIGPRGTAARLDRDDEGVDPEAGRVLQHPPDARGVHGDVVPARHRAGSRLSANDHSAARELAEWRERAAAAWPRVTIRVEETLKHKEMRVGDTVGIAAASAWGLTPAEVAVEIRYGFYDAAGRCAWDILSARHDGRDGDEEIYRVEILARGAAGTGSPPGPSAAPGPRERTYPLRMTWEERFPAPDSRQPPQAGPRWYASAHRDGALPRR